MEYNCTQENLAKALQIVARMVGTRGTLPVLGNVLLATDKGRLKVAATDLEVGIQTWIGGKAEQDGAITVPARLLIDFITTNTDPTINLSVKDTTLHLKSERYTANIKGIDAGEFPLIPDLPKVNPLKLRARDLREAITQTVFATALDETRPVLTGVLLKVDSGRVKLVATDSYRLAERSVAVEGQTPSLQVIVPGRTLGELGRLLGDQTEDVTVYVAENQILFTFGETEFISRLIDGAFPDYQQIIPGQPTTTILLDKTPFIQVMKMASYFARESANNVQIRAKEGEPVEVTAVSPQLGDAVSHLVADTKGEAIDIAFNAKFILDALTIFPGEKLTLEFSGKERAGVLRPEDQKHYLYLIMPLRVDN